MPDFYYQIKGKESETYGGGWAWPPLLSGKVEADNKKQAKALIEEEYGRKFPLRVLRKDIDNESYLLNVREIAKEDEKTRNLFELNECQMCKTKFRIIDKYNDHNESNKGSDFCSSKCQREHIDKNRAPVPKDILLEQGGAAFIYRIRNVHTEKVYIGKTTQAFTLRWYQHFYQSGSCKFHEAIKNSKLTDWEFSLIELVEVPDGMTANDAVVKREAFWINHYNSVEDGYNTLEVKINTHS